MPRRTAAWPHSGPWTHPESRPTGRPHSPRPQGSGLTLLWEMGCRDASWRPQVGRGAWHLSSPPPVPLPLPLLPLHLSPFPLPCLSLSPPPLPLLSPPLLPLLPSFPSSPPPPLPSPSTSSPSPFLASPYLPPPPSFPSSPPCPPLLPPLLLLLPPFPSSLPPLPLLLFFPSPLLLSGMICTVHAAQGG